MLLRMRAAIGLIPHRPPFLLVDEVVAIEGDEVRAVRRVAVDDPLVGDAGLRGPMLIEALAQTAACLMGASGGGAGHLGYLVAAQGWKFSGIVRPGETVALSARRVSALGALHRFEGVARVDGREIAAGTMTFAVRFDGVAPGG